MSQKLNQMHSWAFSGKVVEMDHRNIKAHNLNLTTIKSPCQSVPDAKRHFQLFWISKPMDVLRNRSKKAKLPRNGYEKNKYFQLIQKPKSYSRGYFLNTWIHTPEKRTKTRRKRKKNVWAKKGKTQKKNKKKHKKETKTKKKKNTRGKQEKMHDCIKMCKKKKKQKEKTKKDV